MNGSNTIDASPTKEFFISMLVKDIELMDAIADLVDNSIDGARGVKINNDYAGLYVRIEIEASHFKIDDNCGGFSVEKAQKYAFKFGRPLEADVLPGSIGRFGVGMKRAIFKLGKKFNITSKTDDTYFVLEDDVDTWKANPDNWTFTFTQAISDRDKLPAINNGTTIYVGNLHKPVIQDFTSSSFRTRLATKLSDAHQNALDAGLTISLNGLPLRAVPLTLLYSPELRPAYKNIRLAGVNVKLYSGIAPPNPHAAGWYVSSFRSL
jgi:hypothetical protein